MKKGTLIQWPRSQREELHGLVVGVWHLGDSLDSLFVRLWRLIFFYIAKDSIASKPTTPCRTCGRNPDSQGFPLQCQVMCIIYGVVRFLCFGKWENSIYASFLKIFIKKRVRFTLYSRFLDFSYK